MHYQCHVWMTSVAEIDCIKLCVDYVTVNSGRLLHSTAIKTTVLSCFSTAFISAPICNNVDTAFVWPAEHAEQLY
jgi:hypothetical protein